MTNPATFDSFTSDHGCTTDCQKKDAMIYFNSFDIATFWKRAVASKNNVVSAPLDQQILASIERNHGFKLPARYIALMKTQNGGHSNNTTRLRPFTIEHS
jgi:hypothetical protein